MRAAQAMRQQQKQKKSAAKALRRQEKAVHRQQQELQQDLAKGKTMGCEICGGTRTFTSSGLQQHTRDVHGEEGLAALAQRFTQGHTQAPAASAAAAAAVKGQGVVASAAAQPAAAADPGTLTPLLAPTASNAQATCARALWPGASLGQASSMTPQAGRTEHAGQGAPSNAADSWVAMDFSH